MAYNGYLIKVGTYTFPMQAILFATYKTSHKVQDLDSYRDANGVLHRNVLSHVPDKVEFEIRGMTNKVFDNIIGNIQSQYTKASERKASVEVFVPELNTYITQDMYLVEPEITILKQVDSSTLIYDKTRIAFVGY